MESSKIKSFVKSLKERNMCVQVPRATMHPKQDFIWQNRARFNTVLCGRRFGKTVLIRLICLEAIKGKKITIFAPEFKDIAETWEKVKSDLEQITVDVDNTAKRMTVFCGSFSEFGQIEFFSLTNEGRKDSARGRDSDIVIYEETQKIQTDVLEYHWQKVGRALLTDRAGDGWFFGTAPNSRKHFFYKLICRGAQGSDLQNAHDIAKAKSVQGYKTFRFKTADNPYITDEELEAIRAELPELVYLQEYEAICVEYGESPWLLSLQNEKVLNRIFVKQNLPILPSGRLWLSFDFNNNPMAATLWQIGDKASFVHCLAEFGARKGHEVNVTYTCALVLNWLRSNNLPEPRQLGLLVTGDATGNNKTMPRTHYQIILDELGLDVENLVLFRSNPPHQESHLHCNTYLALHRQFHISASCERLREDMIHTRSTPELRIDKKFRDPHFLDTMRYVLEAATPRKIEKINTK